MKELDDLAAMERPGAAGAATVDDVAGGPTIEPGADAAAIDAGLRELELEMRLEAMEEARRKRVRGAMALGLLVGGAALLVLSKGNGWMVFGGVFLLLWANNVSRDEDFGK